MMADEHLAHTPQVQLRQQAQFAKTLGTDICQQVSECHLFGNRRSQTMGCVCLLRVYLLNT